VATSFSWVRFAMKTLSMGAPRFRQNGLLRKVNERLTRVPASPAARLAADCRNFMRLRRFQSDLRRIVWKSEG
jgi:hypothetical protein